MQGKILKLLDYIYIMVVSIHRNTESIERWMIVMLTHKKYTNEEINVSVDRAIDVLIYLGEKKSKEKSIRELSDELDISKSVLHRILVTLERRNLVIQDINSHKYTLGYGILELGVNLKRKDEIVNLCIKEMIELNNKVKDTIQLAIIDNESILILNSVEGENELRLFSKPGQRYPITYGNFGKIFLSNKSVDDVSHILENYPLKKYASQSIIDKDVYFNKLKEASKEGVSIGIDDPIEGAISFAAPIISDGGEIIAAISIVGVKTPEKIKHLKYYKRKLLETTKKISQKLII